MVMTRSRTRAATEPVKPPAPNTEPPAEPPVKLPTEPAVKRPDPAKIARKLFKDVQRRRMASGRANYEVEASIVRAKDASDILTHDIRLHFPAGASLNSHSVYPLGAVDAVQFFVERYALGTVLTLDRLVREYNMREYGAPTTTPDNLLKDLESIDGHYHNNDFTARGVHTAIWVGAGEHDAPRDKPTWAIWHL